MWKNIILLGLLLGFSAVQAQSVTEIPKNKEDFFKTLSSVVKAKDADLAKDYIEKDFKERFMNPKISESACNKLYKASEVLLKKRMFVHPFALQITEGFLALQNGDLGNDNALASEAFEAGVELKSKSDLTLFLDLVSGIGYDGTFVASNSVRWRFKAGSAQLTLDGKDPILKLKGAELIISTKGDSSNLYNVNGYYAIDNNRLEIEKGRISWEKAGLSKSGNYADFYNASIKCKASFFNLDSAKVTSEFLPEEKWGKVKEKLSTAGTSKPRYPSFETVSDKILIENIVPNVNYNGGFALRGGQLEGFNSAENPGYVEFMKDGVAVMRVSGTNFEIDTAKIFANPAEVMLRLGKEDSLYHPGLSFKYFAGSNKVEMIRNDEGVGEAPFFSSYHNMDFFVQRLFWNTTEDFIGFGSLQGEASKRASFESSNFFDINRYKSLTGYGGAGFNALQKCAQGYGPYFSIKSFSSAAQMSEEDAIRNLIGFANKGFIFYNIFTKKVQVKQKFFDFIDAANQVKDFDNIYFLSSAPKGTDFNAKLNLADYNLDIIGVRKVPLSDSQAVAMYANKGTETLTIKKNLDMEFEGVVQAGNLDFYGDSIFFSYEKFTINLNKVDSVKISVKNDNDKFIRVRTSIEDLVGTLQIDRPDNKSGKEAYKSNFPILNSTEKSYVYYDKKGINGGVYKRDNFYFEINPFELDSLDELTMENTRFGGKMVTGGIFPDIKSDLKIMDDFSLGINYSTSESGLALYDDKTIFTDNIQMTETGGLQGSGSLKFVTSTSESKRFNFLPDSTYGVAQSVVNTKSLANPSTPDFTGTDFQFFLNKNDNYMTATSIKSDFVAYSGQAKVSGVLKLNSKELIHNGNIEMYNGTATADNIRLAANMASSKEADFKLYERGTDVLALTTSNVTMNINFETKIGEFIANDISTSEVKFPKNQYVAFMDKYLWQIDDQKIEMTSSVQATESDSSLASNLMSIHPDQDSLRFVAPIAVFDINDYTIKAEKVKHIQSGDAYIQPGDGKVTILAAAQMETFQNATITADYVNKFHNIFEATVEVIGRKKYLGRGKYDYIDEFGKKQQIAFEDIAVVDSHTVAEGVIPDDQNFKINSFFDYRGGVKLYAQEKGLSFNGTTRIKSNCTEIANNWFAFEGQVDPKNARIPVGEKMMGDSGKVLSVGLTINEKTNELYPAFLSAKDNSADRSLISANGFLWYDDADKSYKIGSEERYNKEAVGNIIALNIETCNLSSEGLHDFGIDLGQVEANVFGKSTYDSKTKKATLSGAMKLDFFFDDKMLENVAASFETNPFLQSFDVGSSYYVDGLKAWLPEKDAKKVVEEFNTSGKIDKYPKSLSSVPFIFAGVDFVWDENSLAFVNRGLLKLASVGDYKPFASLKGNLRIRKLKSGNDLNLYFEVNGQTWYYFRYKQDTDPRLETTSTDEVYTTRLTELKDGDKVKKTKKNETSYRFTDASKQQKSVFLENFN